MVKYIRVSIGTAAVLGLIKMKMLAEPTVAYLMTYYPGKCFGNCSFCTQARTSKTSSEYLSRIVWPRYPFSKVLTSLERSNAFKRICIQTLIYPNYVDETIDIVRQLKLRVDLPISVSIHPRNINDLIKLKEIGVERVGIGVDAVTKQLFNQIKASFSWEKTLKLIDEAIKIFGRGKVSVHLIYGLGERDVEFINFMLKMHSKSIRIGLFTFTPMEGTELAHMKPPKQSKYRVIQLVHYLITHHNVSMENFQFDENGNLIKIIFPKSLILKVIESGEPFVTKGCPDCNRPFYNEPPRGPLYNYPTIKMARADLQVIRKQLRDYIS